MQYQEALDFFGSVRQLAEAFEPTVSVPAVKKWQTQIPPWRQLQLEAMTQGALKADPMCLPDYTVRKETIAGLTRIVRVMI